MENGLMQKMEMLRAKSWLLIDLLNYTWRNVYNDMMMPWWNGKGRNWGMTVRMP